MLKKNFLKNKEFYLMALALALPMIGQNLVTNFVNMVDNIMIGQVGTNQMNAVSIVNQFIFVLNLTIFGGMAGPGIFGTQFYGNKDYKGQQYTFCFRLILAFVVSFVGIAIFLSFPDKLISLFLSENSDLAMRLETLEYGKQYLKIIVLSILPFAIGQAYSSALREVGQTKVPLYGSLSAIGVNVILNYCLIFGKFGFPELGVSGAAIATVVAKFVESAVVIIYAHMHKDENKYLLNLLSGFAIPKSLNIAIIQKGLPLLFNEFLWSFGMSFIAQCFSYRGLEVVAARNIASTLTNLFSSVYIQFGSVAGIIIGRNLGAGDFIGAKESYKKTTFLSTVLSSFVALIMIPFAFVFPEFYNTTPYIKDLATYYIIVTALCIPIFSYTNICYFTLRSGGKTFITFLYDAVYTWIIQIPVCFMLCYKTSLNIRMVMFIVTYVEIIKTMIGYFMVRSDIWIVNIINEVVDD